MNVAMSAKAHSQSGFTLIEVLLVSLLLFFLAFTTFQSVRSTIRSKEIIDASVGKIQEARAALAVMERDIRAAYYYTPADFVWLNPGPRPNTTIDQQVPPPPPPTVTIFQGKATEIFMSSNSHQRMAPDMPQDQQHFVTYQLNGDKLIRAESPRAVNLKDRESPDTFHEFTLLEHIDKLTFQYWDMQNEKWTDSWDTEKTETRDQLPEAVKIDLEYTPEDDSVSPNKKPEPIVVSTAIRLAQPAFKNAANSPSSNPNVSTGLPGQPGAPNL
jgi:hypothetical protein